MSDVSTWDALDANNTLPPPDGWPEFMQPSGVNNCGRMMMGAVRRMYDQQIAGTIVLPYLKLTGGTVSGATTFSAGVTTTNLTATGAVNASGAISAGTSLTAGGNVWAAGYIIGPNALATKTGGAISFYDGGGTQALQLANTGDNYYVNDRHVFRDRTNSANFATLNSGGLTVTAALNVGTGATIGGGVTVGAALSVTGAITSNRADALAFYAPNGGISVAGAMSGASLSASGAVNAGTTIRAGTVLQSGGPVYAYDETNFGIIMGGGLRYLAFKTGCSFNFEDATGNCNWSLPAGLMWRFQSNGFCFANVYTVGGMGDYVNISDRRFKDASTISPATAGLAELLQLRPVRFKRLSRSDDAPAPAWEVGFVAQDVQDVLPEAVRAIGIELPDGTGGLGDPEPTLGLTNGAIVAALVNAIKTIDQRLTAGGL